MRTPNISRERALYTNAADRAGQMLRRDLASLQEQMSTQLRVNRASDDPVAFAEARRTELLTSQNEQYLRSITAARSWGQATEEHLSTVTEIFIKAYEYGLQGSNDTNSQVERDMLATHIDSLREELIQQLNAKHGDEYLFAGHDVLNPPFDATGEPSAAPRDYTRIAGDRIRQIGPGTEIKVNVDGSDVHDLGGGVAITDALKNLADALRNPANPVPLGTAVDQVTKARDHMIEVSTRTGYMLKRLTMAEEQLEAGNIRLKGRQSELEDADFVEVMTALQRKQAHLDAALKVTASMLQTSLINHIP